MNAVMHLQITGNSSSAQAAATRTATSVKGLTGSLNAASAAASRLNMQMRLNNMERFAKNMQWIGRQIEFNFTLPLMLAGGFATKWALENERAMTRVRKVYEDSTKTFTEIEEDLDLLGDTFRLLSDLMGIHQDEVIEIGAAWAQAGANGRALGEITKLTMETMILGEIDAAQATQGLLAIQQQYKLAVNDRTGATEDLTTAVAYLNATENVTAITMEGLIQGMQKSAGIARQAGVTIRELVAAMAAMVPAAGNAREAGTSFRTLVARVMRPTRQTAEALEILVDEFGTTAWASQTFTERLFTLKESFDDLSASQRVAVADMVAGKRQGNRFLILLEELTDANGAYQRSLDATADKTEAINVYNRELERYLSSSPQAVAILTTQMRNLMTEAIQPIIPMMINFLTVVRDTMKGFMDLSNSTKQLLFYIGLFLILIGPIMRVSNAVILLFTSMAKAALWLGGALGWVGKQFLMLGGLVMKSVGFVLSTITGLVSGAFKAVTALYVGMFKLITGIPVVVGKIWAGLTALWTAGMAALARITSAGMFVVQRIWVVGAAVMRGAWSFTEIVYGMGLMFTKLARLSVVGFMNLSKIWAAGIAILSNPWTLLVIAIVGIIAAFRDQIAKLIGDLIDAWYALPHGVSDAMAAVISVLSRAAQAVYEWLQWMNPFARHSPSLVEQVKAGVAIIAAEYASLSNIGRVFGRAVDDLRNFINVTQEARELMRSNEFSELRLDVLSAEPSAGTAFDRVVASIYRLEDALARIQIEYDKQAKVVVKWEAALAAANFELDAQGLILDGLANKASNLQAELNAAQDRLASLMQTPIQGMGAMSDAIFENELAQKRLRLEILRMEDTHGTIDGIRSRMAALSGDIDLLVANREELRLAGAGSDVLGAIDAQLASLEAERRALGELGGDGGPMSEMDQLRQELAELQKQGEILDLENSIQFDPLLRQIDQITNGMREMPFDELLAKIIAEQENIDILTSRWEDANAAMERQQEIVDALQLQRDQIQATYDMELERLNQLSDAYDGIEKQIAAMTSALEEFARTAAAASGGSGAGEGGSPLGPEGEFDIPGGPGASLTGGDIAGLNEELENQLEGLFQFDIWALLREEWNKFVQFLKDKWFEFLDFLGLGDVDWSGFFGRIGDAFSEFFSGVRERFTELFDWEDIRGRLETLKRVFQPIIDAAVEFWHILQEGWHNLTKNIRENWDVEFSDLQAIFEGFVTAVQIVIGILVGAFTLIWPTVRNVFQTIWNWIGEAIGAIIQIFSGLIEFLAGVFTMDLGRMLDGLGNMFLGAFELIVVTVVGAFELIWGIISGVVEGIFDLFKWLWDVLVGNSIIPDMVNAIVAWFQNLRDWVLAPVRFLRDKITEIWNGIKNAVSNKVIAMRDTASGAVNTMKNRIIGHAHALRDKFTEVRGWVDSKIIGAFRWVRDTAAGIWDAVKTKVTSAFNTIESVVSGVVSKITGFISSIQSAWDRLTFGTKSANVKTYGDTIPKTSTSGSSSYGGGYTYVAPTTPYFASGAVLRHPTLGIMAEYAGAASNPEIVTPERLMRQVFSETLDSKVMNLNGGGDTSIVQINGNLEFPNITDGGDAEEFVKNLEAMAV